MTRMKLRRVLTGLSFLAVILGGAVAPAIAAADAESMAPGCWYSRCEGQL